MFLLLFRDFPKLCKCVLYGIDEKNEVPPLRNCGSDCDVKQQVKKQEKGCEEEEEELTNRVVGSLFTSSVSWLESHERRKSSHLS